TLFWSARDMAYVLETGAKQPRRYNVGAFVDLLFSLEEKGRFVLTSSNTIFQLEKNGTISEVGDFFDGLNGIIDHVYYDGDEWLFFCHDIDYLSVFRWDGQRFKLFKSLSGIGQIVNILPSNDPDQILIGSNLGIFTVDKKDWNLEAISDDRGILRSMNAFAQDSKGNFWISKSEHLLRYNPNTEETKTYLSSDGFTNAGHRSTAFTVDQNERLLIGGSNGLNVLDLQEEDQFNVVPQIHIRSILVNNQPIDYAGNVAQIDRIRLPFKQNDLTIKFSSTEFSNPSKNQYRYKLQDNDQWQALGDRNELYFDRLPFGHYNLSIQAANANGVWMKEPKKIAIQIFPPFYLQWWFLILFGLLLTSIAFIAWRNRERRLAIKRESLRLKELDELKTRLYTNITHEFRTPLTVIKGMAEQVRGNLVEKQMINRNSARLLNLVNQMLDLAKLDDGNLKLDMGQTDVVAFVKYIAETYQPYAGSKDIRIEVKANFEQLVMDVDQNKLDQILSNLLSNAIKFSPSGSIVSIIISEDNHQLVLQVADQGIGIPGDKSDQVFDRFFQINDSSNRNTSGTGIGLALTKELVSLMDGKILLQSTPGKGSTFTVRLPIRNQAIWKPFIHPEILQTPIKIEPADALIKEGGAKILPRLLIVEDNPDVATYLASLLQEHYQLQYASNGLDGVKIAKESVPDIIISDIMMPVMDGYELCKQLKEDLATSHIPIILLTAKTHVEDRLEGLKLGADAYLTKPFNREELKIRLKKLIDIRKQMQNKYGTDLLNIQLLKDDDKEESFLNQLRRLVLERIDDKELSTSDLGRAVFLSDSQVNRKLKALTLMTPSEFIRSIRLEHALVLLKTTDRSITQIAYEVGFNQPAYFTRRFQEKYKVSPTEARKGGISQ
ncbi:MAG: ATP-binding protein, partial [Bacteroidota bacterium]